MNLGDDLFIKLLLERYVETHFYVCAPTKYKKIFCEYSNFHCVANDRFFNRAINFIFRKLKISKDINQDIIAKSTDAIVQIGGSVFMQIEDWKVNLSNYKKLLSYKKPIYLLGCNFGPYQSQEFYDLSRDLISQYTDVSFRDYYSYNLFKDLVNTRVSSDIVFTLHENTREFTEKIVVLSVIDLSRRQNLLNHLEMYETKLSELVAIYTEMDYTVYLTSFCRLEGDYVAVKRVLSRIDNKHKSRVKELNYDGNINEVLDLFKRAEIIFATRLHAMIIGFSYDKTVIPIIYNQKMSNVLNDLNYKQQKIEIENLDSLNIKEMVENVSLTYMNLDYKQIGEDSLHHFDQVDKILKE